MKGVKLTTQQLKTGIVFSYRGDWLAAKVTF
jgi:hypothetical protein